MEHEILLFQDFYCFSAFKFRRKASSLSLFFIIFSCIVVISHAENIASEDSTFSNKQQRNIDKTDIQLALQTIGFELWEQPSAEDIKLQYKRQNDEYNNKQNKQAEDHEHYRKINHAFIVLKNNNFAIGQGKQDETFSDAHVSAHRNKFRNRQARNQKGGFYHRSYVYDPSDPQSQSGYETFYQFDLFQIFSNFTQNISQGNGTNFDFSAFLNENLKLTPLSVITWLFKNPAFLQSALTFFFWTVFFFTFGCFCFFCCCCCCCRPCKQKTPPVNANNMNTSKQVKNQQIKSNGNINNQNKIQQKRNPEDSNRSEEKSPDHAGQTKNNNSDKKQDSRHQSNPGNSEHRNKHQKHGHKHKHKNI